MSFSQRPFTATANAIGSAASSVGSAVYSTVAAVPEAAALTGTALRASVPGLPAGGSLNPLPELPEIGMPEVSLPEMKLPKLPNMPQVDLPTIELPEVYYPRVKVSAANIGVPYGEFIGLPEGRSLLPSMQSSWQPFRVRDLGVFDQDEEEAADVRDLAKALDLDQLRVAFFKYAGPDERMDEEEFKLFTKKQKISESLSEMLWRNLDVDGNGIVDADEFRGALETMTKARAWLRYCPTCDFDNSCDYCIEVADCTEGCCPERFCPHHWHNHPDKDRYR